MPTRQPARRLTPTRENRACWGPHAGATFLQERGLIVLDMEMKDAELTRSMKAVSPRTLERFASDAQRAAGLRGEVHILITSNRVVRALNRQFRKNDRATDVLSFPSALAEVHGGDIAISAEIAAQQARAMGHSLTDELKILMLHGMLHLAGYDHENDNGEMARKEERLRGTLGLTSGLIQRAGSTKRSIRRETKLRKNRP